jgi:nitrite reductase/ring-hydroxylating ferredoxin subunit
MEQTEQPTRRGFLAGVSVVFGALPTLAACLVAMRAALAPARGGGPVRRRLCRLDEVPDDGVLERVLSYDVRRGPRVETESLVVFVTRGIDGAPLAMVGECTHLACPVRRVAVDEAEPGVAFHCPCHGGRFARDGAVLGGPPPAPLRRLPVELPPASGGDLHVRIG